MILPEAPVNVKHTFTGLCRRAEASGLVRNGSGPKAASIRYLNADEQPATLVRASGTAWKESTRCAGWPSHAENMTISWPTPSRV
jgi:hypothetical protein